jgi:hypothetical protein
MDTQMTVDELFSIQVSRNGSTQVSRNGHVRQSLEQVISLPDSDLAKELPQPLRDGYEWFREQNRQEALTYLESMAYAREHSLSYQVGQNQARIYDLMGKDMDERAKSYADWVADVIAQETGYSGLRCQIYDNATYWKPFVGRKFRLVTRQRLPNRLWLVVERSWDFSRIQDYSQLIPPKALQVLQLLERKGIEPDRLWVGEPVSETTPAVERLATIGGYLFWFGFSVDVSIGIILVLRQLLLALLAVSVTGWLTVLVFGGLGVLLLVLSGSACLVADPVLCASFGRHVVALAEWE